MKQTCSKCGKDDRTSVIKRYLLPSHREEKNLCESCFKESIKSERRLSLTWKLSGLFVLFIIFLFIMFVKLEIFYAITYFSISGAARISAYFFWFIILILIVVFLQGKRSMREIEAGIMAGLIYGGIYDFLVFFLVIFYTRTTLNGNVFFGPFVSVIIVGIFNGILFGLVYANLYNFLPGKTNIKKSIFLGIFFWIFLSLLGIYTYLRFNLTDMFYFLALNIFLAFIGAILLGSCFGFYWTKFEKNSNYYPLKQWLLLF